MKNQGKSGTGTAQITKSRGQIVKEKLFTLFNFLNFGIAALLFAVGAYSNMLFIAIILLNIIIGIAQEWKAKKLVDELSILNRPTVCVRRDGKNTYVDLDDVVLGDLTALAILPSLFEITAVTSQMAVTILFGAVISGLIVLLVNQILDVVAAKKG